MEAAVYKMLSPQCPLSSMFWSSQLEDVSFTYRQIEYVQLSWNEEMFKFLVSLNTGVRFIAVEEV